MLLLAVNLAFDAVQVAMFASILIPMLRGVWRIPPRILRSHYVVLLEDMGAIFLRPARQLFDALGISRLTRPLDVSPLLAFFCVGWLHRLVLGWFF